MAEGNQPISSVETLRVELERARLALDQARYQNDTILTFLERWRVDVQPVHEHRLMSREHAYGYAKVAIQMTFFLNGGALIAFPAFAQLVGTSLSKHMDFALASIAAFVVGLFLIAITALLAHLSMAADAGAILEKEEYVKAGLNQSLAPDVQKSGYDKIRENAEVVRGQLFGRAIRFNGWAIGLGITSILAFLVGALCAARVFSGVSSGV